MKKTTEKNRILYLHSSGNNIAGSEIVLLSMIEAQQSNFEIKVVLPEKGKFFDLLNSKGIKTEILPLKLFSYFKPWQYLKTIWKLHLFLREYRPDIIHTSSASPVQYAYPAAKPLGIPLVCHIQCPYGNDDLKRYFPHMADKIIVISKYVQNIFPPSVRAKTELIYNGIKSHKFARNIKKRNLCKQLGLPANSLLVGYVGQIIHRKGIDLLIRVLLVIKLHFPEARLLIVGDSENSHGKELKRLISTLNLEEDVIWLGFKKDISGLMASFDLLCVPSRKEGFGLVAAEALSAGTPVIASDLGGLREIISDGENGFLFEPGNFQELAKKIKELLKNPGKRKKMGQEGQNKVREQFSVDSNNNKIRQLYYNLIAQNNY